MKNAALPPPSKSWQLQDCPAAPATLPGGNDYYIVFTGLFTGNTRAATFNGADCLIQSDKWPLARRAGSADASRGHESTATGCCAHQIYEAIYKLAVIGPPTSRTGIKLSCKSKRLPAFIKRQANPGNRPSELAGGPATPKRPFLSFCPCFRLPLLVAVARANRALACRISRQPRAPRKVVNHPAVLLTPVEALCFFSAAPKPPALRAACVWRAGTNEITPGAESIVGNNCLICAGRVTNPPRRSAPGVATLYFFTRHARAFAGIASRRCFGIRIGLTAGEGTFLRAANLASNFRQRRGNRSRNSFPVGPRCSRSVQIRSRF